MAKLISIFLQLSLQAVSEGSFSGWFYRLSLKTFSAICLCRLSLKAVSAGFFCSSFEYFGILLNPLEQLGRPETLAPQSYLAVLWISWAPRVSRVSRALFKTICSRKTSEKTFSDCHISLTTNF